MLKRREERFYFVLSKCICILAAALVFGCAPATRPPSNNGITQADAIRAVESGGNSGAASNSGWNCPSSPNITLKDNIVQGGGTDYFDENFTACRSSSNASEFKIDGTTTSSALCIYPMQAGYDSRTGQYAQTPSLVDAPQCFAINGATVVVQFSASVNINYLLIVDANHTQALDSCLSSSAPCPAHSEGFVQ